MGMTKEEAKELFLNRGWVEVEGGIIYEPEKWREAYVVISKWLEQEPCEDAISRQEVLEYIDGSEAELGHSSENELVCQYIKELPPVTPQPKIGRWIRWYEQRDCDWYMENIPHCKCSECGTEYDPHSSQFIKYCPNCGAKMQEVEE